jgi:hypothetical protein
MVDSLVVRILSMVSHMASHGIFSWWLQCLLVSLYSIVTYVIVSWLQSISSRCEKLVGVFFLALMVIPYVATSGRPHWKQKCWRFPSMQPCFV